MKDWAVTNRGRELINKSNITGSDVKSFKFSHIKISNHKYEQFDLSSNTLESPYEQSFGIQSLDTTDGKNDLLFSINYTGSEDYTVNTLALYGVKNQGLEGEEENILYGFYDFSDRNLVLVNGNTTIIRVSLSLSKTEVELDSSKILENTAKLLPDNYITDAMTEGEKIKLTRKDGTVSEIPLPVKTAENEPLEELDFNRWIKLYNNLLLDLPDKSKEILGVEGSVDEILKQKAANPVELNNFLKEKLPQIPKYYILDGIVRKYIIKHLDPLNDDHTIFDDPNLLVHLREDSNLGDTKQKNVGKILRYVWGASATSDSYLHRYDSPYSDNPAYLDMSTAKWDVSKVEGVKINAPTSTAYGYSENRDVQVYDMAAIYSDSFEFTDDRYKYINKKNAWKHGGRDVLVSTLTEYGSNRGRFFHIEEASIKYFNRGKSFTEILTFWKNLLQRFRSEGSINSTDYDTDAKILFEIKTSKPIIFDDTDTKKSLTSDEVNILFDSWVTFSSSESGNNIISSILPYASGFTKETNALLLSKVFDTDRVMDIFSDRYTGYSDSNTSNNDWLSKLNLVAAYLYQEDSTTNLPDIIYYYSRFSTPNYVLNSGVLTDKLKNKLKEVFAKDRLKLNVTNFSEKSEASYINTLGNEQFLTRFCQDVLDTTWAEEE